MLLETRAQQAAPLRTTNLTHGKFTNPILSKTERNGAPGASRERHSPEWRFVGWRFCVWMAAAHVSSETWGFCFTIESSDESDLDVRHGLLEYDE